MAPLDATDSAGYTALMHCCVSGHMVALMLDSGCDVNLSEAPNGSTALLLAARYRSVHTVHSLLSRGARLTRNANGASALHMAVGNPDSTTVIQYLLQAHADPCAQDALHQRCALSLSVLDRNEAAALLLLRWRQNFGMKAVGLGRASSGVVVVGSLSGSVKSPNALAPLDLLNNLPNEYLDYVLICLCASTAPANSVMSANATSTTGISITALTATCRRCHAAGRRVALKRWVSAQTLNRLIPSGSHAQASHSTLLHLAVARGMVDTTKLLLEGGARLDVLDSLGYTALDVAEREGQEATAAALRPFPPFPRELT